MTHLMTDNGIACGNSSKYANTWHWKKEFEEEMNNKQHIHHLCKKCLAKFKVSITKLSNEKQN